MIYPSTDKRTLVWEGCPGTADKEGVACRQAGVRISKWRALRRGVALVARFNQIARPGRMLSTESVCALRSVRFSHEICAPTRP